MLGRGEIGCVLIELLVGPLEGWYSYTIEGWYAYTIEGWYSYTIGGWYSYTIEGWYSAFSLNSW